MPLRIADAFVELERTEFGDTARVILCPECDESIAPQHSVECPSCGTQLTLKWEME